jgi:hypothetical protein
VRRISIKLLQRKKFVREGKRGKGRVELSLGRRKVRLWEFGFRDSGEGQTIRHF